MRLIYLHRLHLNGSGQTIQVLRDYHALASRGHDVHLFYRAERALAAKDVAPLLERYNLAALTNFSLHCVGDAGGSRRALANQARALLLESRTPVVLVTRTLDHAAQALRLRRQRLCLILIELHETAIPHMVYAEQGRRFRAWISRWREKKIFREVDGIICTVGSQATLLHALFRKHAAHAVLPNGVDLAAFGERGREPSPHDGVFRLRYAGQFTAWKNTAILFSALQLLPSQAVLELAGGKADEEAVTRATIEAAAARLGISDRVRYVGFIPPRAVPAFLCAADALLLPLGDNVQSRFFTSPMKLFEYAAANVPMIVTRQPTTESLVEDHEHALLVQAGSAQDLARAVQALISDPPLRERLASAARSWVEQYTYGERAQRYENFVAGLKSAGAG